MENPNHAELKPIGGILSAGDPRKNLAIGLGLFFLELVAGMVVFIAIVSVVSIFLP